MNLQSKTIQGCFFIYKNINKLDALLRGDIVERSEFICEEKRVARKGTMEETERMTEKLANSLRCSSNV